MKKSQIKNPMIIISNVLNIGILVIGAYLIIGAWDFHNLGG